MVERGGRQLPRHPGRGPQPLGVRVHLRATAPSRSRARVRPTSPIRSRRRGPPTTSSSWTPEAPWIAAVDAAGVGLLQVSSRRLRGRKLFTWGKSGGRRWQEFLTGSTESYFEIQGGLTRTQLEHVPLGPGASWSWTEVYGPVSVPADAVHGEWADAVECLEPAVAEAQAESVLGGGARADDDGQGERVHAGSGWGRWSRFGVRSRGSRPRPSSTACSPDPASRTTRSTGSPCWKRAPCRLERRAPMSLAGPGRACWKRRRTRPRRCCTGVVRWSAGHREAAVEAWEAACALEPDSWLALRNLAAASGLMGAPGRSAEQYLRALDLMPDLPQLRVEAIEALIAADRLPEAIALAQTAPPSSFAGRFRFLEARAAVLHGDDGRPSPSSRAVWRSPTCGKARSRSRISGSPSIGQLQGRRAPSRTCPSSTTSGWMAEPSDPDRAPPGRGAPRPQRPRGPCRGRCGCRRPTGSPRGRCARRR